MTRRSLRHYADRLSDAVARVGSPACVGLDPVLERLPAMVRERHSDPVNAIETYCNELIDAAAGRIAIIKPQSACFERYGGLGVLAMQRIIARARQAGMIVILDAKRGDIGVSAQHYAAFAFEVMDADALTVNASLGADTIEPYLSEHYDGRGLYVLVRTSNPGSDALQSQPLQDGRTVAEMMADVVVDAGARRIGASGLSSVGAVVAATKPHDAAALRARMPQQTFLIPGYGAQGGTPDTVRELFLPDGRGAIVTASRSVIYAYEGRDGDWREAVVDAAEQFAKEIGALAASAAR